MSEQAVLFAPGSGGYETLQARLIARRDDPQTSKAAARRVTKLRVDSSLFQFLDLLHNLGPLTCI
jgi:hypothetical protein